MLKNFVTFINKHLNVVLARYVFFALFSLTSYGDTIVKGNYRVPADKIKMMVSHVFDEKEAYEVLNNSNLFEWVKTKRIGGDYVIEVQEKPVISRIIFVVDGDKKQKEDLITVTYNQLIQVTELTPGTLMDSQRIKSAINRIRIFYNQKNYLYVRINHEIKQREADGQVWNDLYIHVNRGPEFELGKVEFIGLRELDPAIMNKQLSKRVENYVIFTSLYPEPLKLRQDYANLIEYAKDEGFLHAKVNHSFIENFVDEEGVVKQNIYISFDEGPKCEIGKVSFKVTHPIVEQNLLQKFSGVAKQTKLVDYVSYIIKEYKNSGQHVSVSYVKHFRSEKFDASNANDLSTQKTSSSCAQNIMDVEFFITPVSARHVISKLIVKGNSSTRSSVITKASKLFVGSYFDPAQVSLIEHRVMCLGFFKFATVQHYPDPQTEGQVVVINVEDAASGAVNLQGALGWSGARVEASLSFFYQHPNFIGSGNEAMLAMTLSRSGSEFNIAYRGHTIADRDIGYFVNFYAVQNDDESKTKVQSSVFEKIEPRFFKNKTIESKAKDLDGFNYSIGLAGLSGGLVFNLHDYGDLTISVGVQKHEYSCSSNKDLDLNSPNCPRFYQPNLFPHHRIQFEFAVSHKFQQKFSNKQSIVLNTAIKTFLDGKTTAYVKFVPELKFRYPFNKSQSVYINSTVSFGYMHPLTKNCYWVDHFKCSEVRVKGFRYFGPTERNLYTLIGGNMKFNAYAELITPFVLPTKMITMFSGVYVGSIWGGTTKPEPVSKQYSQDRNWTDEVEDIAGLDFNLRGSIAAGLRIDFGIAKLELSYGIRIFGMNDETDSFHSLFINFVM